MPAKMVAFYSPKGGVGKTTLSTQTSVYATYCDQKVAFYDLDAQQSAAAYFKSLADKTYCPAYLFSDINQKPPKDTDLVIVDCAPGIGWVPNDNFTIVAPVLPSPLDLHSYQKVLEFEERQPLIKVLNQFTGAFEQNHELLKDFKNPVIVGLMNVYRYVMREGKTIIDTKNSYKGWAINQIDYLSRCMMKGKAEPMTWKKYRAITMMGYEKYQDAKDIEDIAEEQA